MFELAIIIMIGALAWSWCSNAILIYDDKIYHYTNDAYRSTSYMILSCYLFLSFPIAFFNGFLIQGLRGSLIVGVGTLLGKLAIKNICFSNENHSESLDYSKSKEDDLFYAKMRIKRESDDRKIQFGIFFCLLNLLLTIKIIFS